MISLRNVTVHPQNAPEAIGPVSLDVAKGETMVLLGGSGAGKSTLLKAIMKLLPLKEGSIQIDGRDIAAEDSVTVRRSIGMVFQHAALFPHLTVAQNIALPLRASGASRAVGREQVERLLEILKLDPALYRHRLPHQLSGGQRQRIGVARALVRSPRLLLMDEPFGALDAITRRHLQDELRQLRDTLGITILFVTHDVMEAVRLGDRLAVMEAGKIHQTGTVRELLEYPATSAVESPSCCAAEGTRHVCKEQRRMTSVMAFLHAQSPILLTRTAEHLQLTGLTLLLAFSVGVTLAVFASRHAFTRNLLLASVSMLQTVPGIALLVMMMALFGRIGTVPALAALFLYALLPIVQNTLTGLAPLPPELAEAAKGIGLTTFQRMRYVRLPLAMPMMLAGLRTSAVQTVGLATLAAFIGAGGLGQFINRGLFLSDTRLILLGAVPTTLMALLIHGWVSLIGWSADVTKSPRLRRGAMLAALILLVALGAFTAGVLYQPAGRSAEQRIVIGSKNFTEQLIVAEMLAQTIERHSSLSVERRFGLGGSPIIHRALVQGTIDMAVEYTGTALAGILHLPTPEDHALVFPIVQTAYHQQFVLEWLPPLGFDNRYVLAVRTDDARLTDITTLSALKAAAPALTAAFDFEFAERDDGYKGLRSRYGFAFGSVIDMHPDLLYGALADKRADVISAYATDGRLMNRGFRILMDDQHLFPPYEAAVVIRSATLKAHPELKNILLRLSGSLSSERMRALNAAVDAKRLSVEQAASQALQEK